MRSRRPHPLAERLVNRTGGPSVRGQVVSAHTTVDSVQLQSNEFDAFGVMLETGVPDGQYCWVQLGGKCQMLLKDGTAATAGHVVFAADTDGRCITAAIPSPPNADSHFKEVGHCIQSANAGTNVLIWVVSHFN